MFRRILLVTACVLGLSASVEAAVLATPLLLVAEGRFMSCLISNVSDHDTTVRIEVFSFTGVPLADSGLVTLGAGQTDGQSAYENARCKFTVQATKSVRAHGTVNESGVGSVSSVEAK
jgi:hypothetical protein